MENKIVYDSIVIGCGFAGSVIARELASKKGKKVLILEQRHHIGGNAFDRKDEAGILVHQYGPHIFHTNNQRVYEYLSEFTQWYDYSHEVVGNINGRLLPIPFNLNTLTMVYGEEKGERLRKELVEAYGLGSKVPILQLMKNDSNEIKEIAAYIYENIFLKYTMKQWGQTPKEIDASVSGRVPIVLSYDNRYFQDKYQGTPLEGYTALFKNLLDHPNIRVKFGVEAKEVLSICPEDKNKIQFMGQPFQGEVIYTGAIDELFQCKYGRLPYRSLHFEFEHYDREYFQTHGVVNYTVSQEYTRITEFKYLTGQKDTCGTTIIKEYPIPYQGEKEEIPYYAIINEENTGLYNKYVNLLKDVPDFYLLGRLAEYKYYNMDSIVEKALDLVDRII
jgi:UDP-galactopyranose mutase